MDRELSDADRHFLIAAARDIQLRLGAIAAVSRVAVEWERDGGLSIVLSLRAGSRRLEYRGTGENLTDAYRALLQRPPLSSASEHVDSSSGIGAPPGSAAHDSASSADPAQAPEERHDRLTHRVGLPSS